MNLILTGMRGTGKTTLGQQLAEHLDRPFLDIDHEIEKRTGMKVHQLVEKQGWPAFRQLEKDMTQLCAQTQKTVIATGGGTLMDPENAQRLKAGGKVILLTCTLEALRKNLEESHARPALTSGKSSLEELEEIWEERKATYYAVADVVHDTTDWPNLDALLEKIKPFLS